MDPGGVGDVAAADGEVERAVQLGEAGGEITGRRQRHAEGVAGVTLVAGRSGSDGHGDGLGGPLGGMLGPVDALEGVGAGGQDAGPGRRRPASRGTRRDRLLVGLEGVVVATALQQAPAAPLVEDRGAGGVPLRIELGERIGDQLGRPIEVAGAAGDIGGSIDDLGARHRQVDALAMLVVVERRQQPVVVALGLGQGIGQLGVDRGGEGRSDGPVAAPGRRPVVDEGGRPARRRRARGRSRWPGRRRRAAPARSPGSSSPSTASWTRAWRKA